MLKYVLESIFQPYILIFVFSICVAFIAIIIVQKPSKKKLPYIVGCYFMALFGMLVGAKLSYILEKAINREVVYATFYSGFSYVGGIIGYIGFIKLYTKLYKETPQEVTINIMMIIPLIYSIAKIGCYYSGCCTGITKFPLQIIECFLYVTIYVIMAILYKKDLYRASNSNCVIVYLGLMALSIFRFFIDFIRADRTIIFMHITLPQMLCLIFIYFFTKKLLNINQTVKHSNIKI